ncbi:N-acetylglucosamine-6-phosphate deacetylase [Agromyces aerolatus]|uniref:N-acetylglucosamine-6-phosphate deacetylase n=1 Tax=Agromyces sp. LY-1074 TaxID=3074080 RepID=UPI00285CCBAC|nr:MULTISPECIES: N-acetylglucosamine-6-phosphate deacetylase [unclassified Agromyces]MDR5700487.1 N-acetylglucosamine-6-phosphate deacetylase [Agromyces sp. LY-1074]MDR5707008.1 N-acetylglucosamine-6-phosphate deacetylase [Agromyces sp. LY-1358]
MVLPDSVVDEGWVVVDGGRISDIGSGTPPLPATNLGGAWLLPGFVDLHAHGGGGGSFAGGEDSARVAADFHLRHGTTSLLASIGTDDAAQMAASCRALVPLCGDGTIRGIHLEGPFLSVARRGAHRTDLLRLPDLTVLEELLTAGAGSVRSVTIAPELPGARDAMARLDAAGVVVAFGHTDADAETMVSALSGRRGYITHLFNGMTPMHHRESAGAIAALLDPDCMLELVNDGVHVHPQVVNLVFAVATGRVALVTDAISAAGMPDGRYGGDGHEVDVKDGQAWTTDGRSLAGSTLTMSAALRNTVQGGVSIINASEAASGTPARALGLDSEIGSISIGHRADLVVLDDTFAPRQVFVAGLARQATAC